MQEYFTKACVAAIIEKTVNQKKYILIQTRQKEDGGNTNGLIEIAAGKIQAYENVFTALRREILEETGLHVTEIVGEEKTISAMLSGNEIISFEPFCITQNLSGVYPIMLNTFICYAEGDLLESTNETTDIHWVETEKLAEMLENNLEQFFCMNVNALRKYISQL